MKKKFFVLLLVLSLVFSFYTNVEATNVASDDVFSSTELVTMKPVKKVYYDIYREKEFTPSKKIKQDAQKLYKKMRTGKQITVKYKNKNRDIYYWGRVYSYLNTTYFPYEHINFKDSWADGTYLKDIIGKGEYKRLVKRNKQVKQAVQSILTELQIDENTTKVEAVLRINDWFNKNCKYVSYNDGSEDYVNYHMLLYKEGICTDYSYAFKILCNSIGIECGVVGEVELCHAYNVCVIDGRFYYIDVTWNKCGNQWLFLTEEEIRLRGRNIDSIDWALDL